MTCYRPVKSSIVPSKGLCFFGCDSAYLRWYKYRIRKGAFDFSKFSFDELVDIDLPCNHCIGCALDYNRGWTFRLLAEYHTQKYVYFRPNACMVTLTYADPFLPENGSLKPQDVQLFVKRVREHYRSYFGLDGIKFYLCGEYGDNNTRRPHYHVIFYGINFREAFDLISQISWNSFARKIVDKYNLYCKQGLVQPCLIKSDSPCVSHTSALLSSLWNKGHVAVSPFNALTCGYVSGYTNKRKIIVFSSKQEKKDYYKKNGVSIEPEFSRSSKGLGSRFFDDYYKSSIYSSKDGLLRIEGAKNAFKIPIYFDRRLKVKDPEMYEKVKQRRLQVLTDPAFLAEHTPERLAVKEELALLRFHKKVRALDHLVESNEFNCDFCFDLEQKLSSGSAARESDELARARVCVTT